MNAILISILVLIDQITKLIIKNVIALSAGMLEGLNANESTKAMLITEAMRDMEEILFAFGAKNREGVFFFYCNKPVLFPFCIFLCVATLCSIN